MAFSDLVTAMDSVVLDVLGGVPVTYTPASGPAVSVSGMFDDNYIDTKGKQSTLATSIPVVVLKLADLPEDPRTTRPLSIQISGVSYAVRGHETDGVPGGSIQLQLRESS